jgi:iron complex outermembrane receptor protein
VPNLSQLSIEDLLNLEITSASRKRQRVEDVAAAVFVITRDDIRRSGMTTIPDVLRLAPGVDVAQINSNKWAVSVRGFNGLYANKLLVLVDGRSVYSRLFAGVLWGAEDLVLDDIDRIEVVRGPGAAMWGANAVNGVINIVTSSAAETQGGLVRVEAGHAGGQGVVRYGAALGAMRYRVFAQWTGRNESLLAPGIGADDHSRSATTGFRADWNTEPDSLTLEGAFTTGRSYGLWPNLDPQTAVAEPISDVASETRGGHLLAHWSHTREDGALLEVQSFLDLSRRHEPVGDHSRRAVDVEAQYRTTVGGRHDLVVGAGYRFVAEGFAGRVGLLFTPDRTRSSLLTAFAQNEIALGRGVSITLGSQVQHDPFSGAGVQPTARVMWKAGPGQRLWGAVSRALRTPALNDRGVRVELPPVRTVNGLPLVVGLIGNPAAETETLVDAEVGYRAETGRGWSIDVTGFVGRYDHLRTQEALAPIVQLVPSPRVLALSQFGNQLQATTRGVEVAGNWTPVASVRVHGSYSAFTLTPDLRSTSRDPAAALEDGNAPGMQWQVRSSFTPGSRAQVDVAVFRVGRLERLDVDGYTRADLNASWQLTSRVAVIASVHNLGDAAHVEFAGASTLVQSTQARRSASLRLRWTFR